MVAENILAFNTTFWLRLATRADLTDAEEQVCVELMGGK